MLSKQQPSAIPLKFNPPILKTSCLLYIIFSLPFTRAVTYSNLTQRSVPSTSTAHQSISLQSLQQQMEEKMFYETFPDVGASDVKSLWFLNSPLPLHSFHSFANTFTLHMCCTALLFQTSPICRQGLRPVQKWIVTVFSRCQSFLVDFRVYILQINKWLSQRKKLQILPEQGAKCVVSFISLFKNHTPFEIQKSSVAFLSYSLDLIMLSPIKLFLPSSL